MTGRENAPVINDRFVREVFRDIRKPNAAPVVWAKFESAGKEFGIEIDYVERFCRVIEIGEKE